MPNTAATPLTASWLMVVVGSLSAPRAAVAVWPGHAEYSLGILDGTDGFVVTTETSTGQLGYSVSAAGDVNNDGFNDIILGEAPEFGSTAGAAYVIFGSESSSFSQLDVSDVDGSSGFKIEGTDIGDYAGTSVAGAGDVNGDGFDDVIVGAWGASSAAGEVLVVFGAVSHSAVVDASDLDGNGGFVIRGAATSDAAGFSVASAGDVNNDGAADIVVGAYRADPEGSMSGAAYIVFGSTTWSEDIVELAELGTGGITLEGGYRREYAGYSVAGAGDVNDDGYSDVIVAAYGANEAYVFYGAAVFGSNTYVLNTLSGVDGFTMVAGNDGDTLAVAGVGDLNDDGYGDVAVGHALADPSANSAGATYVILGGSAISSPLNLVTELDGTNGFTLQGSTYGDRSGSSVANAGDINQDGYGDVVVGAPGVGDNVGAAYILFGGSTFATSYNLGSLDGDDGFRLTAPTSGGYAGCSVAGLGDTNQDGYPDLAIGAYRSGSAGEAYVVFPHLTGTPPPSPSPTPAPTAAPHRRPDGATPAPTVNFLVDGVVGGGTIYEAPGVFVRAQELGGKVSLGTNRWFDEDTSVSVSIADLKEKNLAGGIVGLGADIPHVVDGSGVVYTAAATTDAIYGGVAARTSNMTSSVLGGEVTITMSMYVFEESGVITNGEEQLEVTAGALKISLSLSDWPFCDPDPSTTTSKICRGASSALETGSYLDAVLLVQGPSSATPTLDDDTANGAIVGAGMRYSMSGGSADAALVMSEWIRTDEYGWTKADAISLSGSTSFTIRFPASSGTLYYDPTVELVLTPNQAEEFWERTGFRWFAGIVGFLVLVCLLGFALGTYRRRRASKDKVSPGFEGVAPPADKSIADGGAEAGGLGKKILHGLRRVACCGGAGRPAWYKRARAAPAPSSECANKMRTTGTRIKFPSMKSSGSSAKKQRADKDPIVLEGGGDDKTEGASETNAVTPDWIKDLKGDAGGTTSAAADAANSTSAVPDWLAEVAGPTVMATAGATSGAGADQPDQEDGNCYQGYEGHEGYGYDGYEGYDGYGYAGYYDAGYYDYNAGGYYGGGGGEEGGGEENSRSTPAVTPKAAPGGGGGGMSWLTNAASTVDALNEREDDADVPAGNPGSGARPGASRLPPIGGTGGGADGAVAPMPWMNAR